VLSKKKKSDWITLNNKLSMSQIQQNFRKMGLIGTWPGSLKDHTCLTCSRGCYGYWSIVFSSLRQSWPSIMETWWVSHIRFSVVFSVENMAREKKLLMNWKLQSDTPTSVFHVTYNISHWIYCGDQIIKKNFRD
jgi:hypothetical protein